MPLPPSPRLAAILALHTRPIADAQARSTQPLRKPGWCPTTLGSTSASEMPPRALSRRIEWPRPLPERRITIDGIGGCCYGSAHHRRSVNQGASSLKWGMSAKNSEPGCPSATANSEASLYGMSRQCEKT